MTVLPRVVDRDRGFVLASIRDWGVTNVMIGLLCQEVVGFSLVGGIQLPRRSVEIRLPHTGQTLESRVNFRKLMRLA